MHPPGFEPMLASTGQALDGDGWAFDLKLDGWRTLVHVRGGRVAAYSRPGRDITPTVPELSGLADVLPEGTVLDGELVTGTGRASSFYRLAPLLASGPQRRASPVTFVAFDVLALGGRRMTAAPYDERRQALEELRLASGAWCTVPQWRDVVPDDLLAACEELDVEGVVAKRLTSRYRPGQRSPDWRKIKTVAWRQFHAPYRRR